MRRENAVKRNTSRPRGTALCRSLAVLGAFALGAAGCASSERPVVSGPETYAYGTLVEYILWIEEQTDHAIAVSGVGNNWLYPFGDGEEIWGGSAQRRYEILGSMLPLQCGDGGRIMSDVVAVDVTTPHAAAARVRAAWERDGWAVTDLFDPPGEGNLYFRADQADGAFLTLETTPDALILGVTSACSLDPTMSPRLEDLSERDAFLEHIMTGERP